MSTQSSSMRTRALQFVASVALLVTAIGVAAEERYLLPVFVTIDGAHGSRFASYVHILNAGPATIALRGMEFPCVTLCPSRSPSIPLEPYRAVSILAGGRGSMGVTTGRPGWILKAADDAVLRINLRVSDVTRANLSAGTEIPVVHESRMQTGVVHLIGIPPEGQLFRNRLRVYAFTPATVRVVFIRTADNMILRESTLQLVVPGAEYPPDQEFYPAYAEIADFPADTGIRLQIEPQTGADRLWAFVTSTNNEKQEITVVTPQP